MHAAILDSVHPVLTERLAEAGHTCVMLHNASEEELVRSLNGVQVIVVRSRMLDAKLMGHAPSLRVVGRVGAGLENIDRAHCAARGIRVLGAPEGNRDGVGELCVAQTLMLMKHVVRANAQVHLGVWLREENRGTDLFGKTVGIIGYGQMGRAFAEKLSGFGVRILAHDKYIQGFGNGNVTESTLADVLRDSDVISLHLPLNAETRHYADAAFFARIGRPVWFLNTSRGQVVHTAALLDALDAGRVIAAALDVLEFERPDLSGLDPMIDPATQRRLLAHERVLLTPHIAGVTHEGKFKMADILATKILDAIADERS
jgi:D-3-phosphoglycerate dehydrogenase / 2-oxoglutarate reductase